MPQKSPFTRKIKEKTHEEVKHASINATLSALRRKCLKCRRLKGKPGSEPFAPLPKNRVLESNPLKITGVDFAGPLYNAHENQRIKAYVMLLTCAVIRVVDLELVPDMTTEC